MFGKKNKKEKNDKNDKKIKKETFSSKDTEKLNELLNEENDEKDKENSEKINKKNKYSKSSRDVIGGIFGDKDSRTRHSANSMITTITFSSLILAGIILLPFKMNDYHNYVINNTTPIGDTMTFKKTDDASLTLKEVYTDKNRDLTIVRLGYNDNTLLTKTTGKAYGLHLLVENKNVLPKDFKMSYGILGTDGDGYLFLKGKLQKQAYQIVIANRSKFRLSSDEVNGNDSSAKNPTNFKNSNEKKTDEIQDEEKQTVTSLFASEGLEDANDNGHLKSLEEQENNNNPNTPDMIDFRVNPYSKSTKVYNGSFLNSNGDIDYSKVIEIMNVKPNVKINEQAKKEAELKLENFKKAKEEYKKRLEMNPDDEDAKEALENIDKNIKEQEETIRKANKQIEALKAFKFNKDSFGKIQESFDIQQTK